MNEKFLKLNVALNITRKHNIRMQPTSVTRCRIGLTKRNTAVSAGRPNKLNLLSKRKQKKKHSLKENINSNAANSKK